MANELPTITLKAIGFVRSEVKEASPLDSRNWGEIVSEIVIDSNLT